MACETGVAHVRRLIEVMDRERFREPICVVVRGVEA